MEGKSYAEVTEALKNGARPMDVAFVELSESSATSNTASFDHL